MKYSLICFDMDGVIFSHSNTWKKIHELFGTLDKGARLEKKYLKTDYPRLVDEVVNKLWKGRYAKPYYEMIKKLEYNPSAKELFKYLKKKGIKTAIISSGPVDLVRRAQKELGIDYAVGNELVIKDNVVTGEFKAAHDWHGKGATLKDLCKKEGIDLKDVVVVGDDSNDVSMMKIAGLSISFNSISEELDKIADITIKGNDLREILKHVK